MVVGGLWSSASLAAMAARDPKLVLAGVSRRSPLTVLAFAGMGLCGVAFLAVLAHASLSKAGIVPFVVGLTLAPLPFPLLILGVLTLDRLEPEPGRNLALAFVWGACVSTLFALIGNEFGAFFLASLFGKQAGESLTPVVVAPVVEEVIKALGLFGFLWFRHQELDGPTDGIIYAAMVGLGFAMVEDVLYYTNTFTLGLAEAGAAGGVVAVTVNFVMRGILTPMLHPLFTSMTGIALGYVALKRTKHVRIALPAAGLAGGIVLHAVWNFVAGLNDLLYLGVMYLAVLVPALFAVITVTLVERRRVVRFIERYVPEEVPGELVAPADIRMLSTFGSRRHARSWARLVGGVPAGRAMRDYQLAVTELVLLRQREERGVADAEWARSRRTALLDLVRGARDRLLRRLAGRPRPPWAWPDRSGFAVPPPRGP